MSTFLSSLNQIRVLQILVCLEDYFSHVNFQYNFKHHQNYFTIMTIKSNTRSLSFFENYFKMNQLKFLISPHLYHFVTQ